MINFETGRLIGRISGIIIIWILFVFCVYKLFGFLKKKLPQNVAWLVPSGIRGFFGGLFLWLAGSSVADYLLQPWLTSLSDGSVLQPVGWILLILTRCTGFFGFGLLLYACTGGLVHLFRRGTNTSR